MIPITRIFDLLSLYEAEYQHKTDAFLERTETGWKAWSAEDYIRQSRELALGFCSLGLTRGSRVATVIANAPQWNFVDMGLLLMGAVQVPVYPTISTDDYHYILSETNPEILIIQGEEIYQRLTPILQRLPEPQRIYSVEPVEGIPLLDEIRQAGAAMLEQPTSDRKEPGATVVCYPSLQDLSEAISPDDLASIIYTSGTTGMPKGVMLTHRNFVSNFTTCAKIPPFKPGYRALSFLPLCHVYERMLNYLFQYHGLSIYYARQLEQVPQYLLEVRPHTFASVPRVLEKVYNKIVRHGRNLTGFQRRIFFWALRQGYHYERNIPVGGWRWWRLQVAGRFVFKRWREALGGHIKVIVSGGASLHPRLARIFWAAGIRVLEGYGLTETSPVIAVQNLKPGGVRFGTVGSILEGVEVRIAQDGEILTRGPNLMLGYFNRPELTARAIDADGWFHTGDVGMILDGQYLCITDRKREIFKTSTGRFIAPQPIEQRFKESPFIEYIIILGEARKYAAALIVPSFDHLRSWCEIKGIPFGSRARVIKNPYVIKRIREEVNRINQDLGQTEKVKKFKLLWRDWGVESGELSPTLKLRRKFIQEKYYDEIEQTYKSNDFNFRTSDE